MRSPSPGRQVDDRLAGGEDARSTTLRPPPARAWSAESGLPRSSPSIASRESQPTTSGDGCPGSVAPRRRRAIAAALALRQGAGGLTGGEAGDVVLGRAADHDLGFQPAARSSAKRWVRPRPGRGGGRARRQRGRLRWPESHPVLRRAPASRRPAAGKHGAGSLPLMERGSPIPRSSWLTGWSGSAGSTARRVMSNLKTGGMRELPDIGGADCRFGRRVRYLTVADRPSDTGDAQPTEWPEAVNVSARDAAAQPSRMAAPR